ncbi:hypothetical protein [Streptomyces sp. NPDC127084]|uniref:maleate cis-trans isomerase family protein n=1 Tax=Streptomyces sp. NPDC127084 TaxID=3347133 RepID=UPI003664994E
MTVDLWGRRARIGILVIDKDPVPETEFWAMAPPGVSVHAARFGSPRQPGSEDYGEDPAERVAGSAELARGLDALGAMELDAICLCFTTSSFFGGVGFDQRFIDRATRAAHAVPVTTVASAMTAALRESGVTRPYLVVPPWFKPAIVEAGERYFADAGFPVAGTHLFDLGTGWRNMKPWEVWDHGGQWHVDPDEVCRQVRRTLPADADGVLMAGSGFRTLAAIGHLESDLCMPVITSNQAGLWESLRIAGIAAPAPQQALGRLFSTDRGRQCHHPRRESSFTRSAGSTPDH